MNKLLLSVSFIFCISLQAQTPRLFDMRRSAEDGLRSTLSISGDNKIGASEFIRSHGMELGMGPQAELRPVAQTVDAAGFKHYRYQQFYQGIEVLGSQYILHEKDGALVNGNGALMAETAIEPAAIQESEAMEIAARALRAYPSEYELASSRPVIINTEYPGHGGIFVPAFVLVYDSHRGVHDSRKMIVDARNGNIIRDFSIQMNCFPANGKIQTLYHGEHDIDADAGNNNFLSINSSRGNGIFVSNKAGQIYSDDDNFWQAGTKDYDNGMHDLFWGLQKTYDFYSQRLQRNGADNNNLQIKAFLLDTEAYVNAFWSPNLLTLNFGVGDFKNYRPLTSLDVVAHEFTHGVTQFSAGLEYLYEAGALNESFSDIMGKAVEYAYDRDSFNWYIGARFAKTRALAFRSMEDPNLYNNPKFYKGKRWATGTGDNGGVHTNSGVLNHWYYLLCTGVRDTNEANYIYDVKRFGFDTMTRFAYTLLNNYLGVASNYQDAREASLLLATNWWGACSPEYNNIAEAWRAVGVGTGISDRDLAIANSKTVLNSCKDGYYSVECRINNQGCNVPIPAGSQINMYYKFDTAATVKEVLTLDKDLPGGSHIDYVFSNVPRIVKAGQSRLTVWLESATDADTSNNRYSVLLNRLANASDHDFRLNNITVTGAPCPNSSNEYAAFANSLYNGCTVIPPGNNFELQFIFKDSMYTHRFKNITSVYPGLNLPIPNIRIPRSFIGLKKVQLNLVWSRDTVLPNNRINTQIVMIDNRMENVVETFGQGRYDSARIQVNADSFNLTRIQQDPTLSSEAVVVTGGKFLNANGTLIPQVRTDFAQLFNSNSKFTTKIYVCADVAGIVRPRIEFDLAYKKGSFKFDSAGIPVSAGLRMNWLDKAGNVLNTVFYNAGDSVMQSQHVSEELSDNVSYIDLTILCFQGSDDPAAGLIDYRGDVVAVDNVVISGATSVSDASGVRDIRVFPNPSSGDISITAKNESLQSVQVYNMFGSEVFSRHFLQPSGRCEVGGLQEGPYLVRCRGPFGEVSFKVLVMK